MQADVSSSDSVGFVHYMYRKKANSWALIDFGVTMLNVNKIFATKIILDTCKVEDSRKKVFFKVLLAPDLILYKIH